MELAGAAEAGLPRSCGKEGAAEKLTSTIAVQQNDLRNQNSKAAGKDRLRVEYVR